MLRRKRLLAWLAGSIIPLALVYAVSPWIVAGVVGGELAGMGLTNIHVRAGYPGWHGLRLSDVQFNIGADDQEIVCRLHDVDVTYRPAELMAGAVKGIRVHGATARVQAAAQAPAAAPTGAGPGLGTQSLALLLSGQWLSRLPVGELSLDRLTVDGRTPSGGQYSASASGNIRAGELSVNGELELTPSRRFTFVYAAKGTGETRLAFFPIADAATPVLELTAAPATVDPSAIHAKGSLHVALHPVLSAVAPWWHGTAWLMQVEGQLDMNWRAAVPVASTGGAIALSLQQVKGNGRFNNIVLSGLSAEIPLALGDGVRTSGDARLHVDELNVGLPISAIDAGFRLVPGKKTSLPVVHVRKASAHLLGGAAQAGPFSLDPAQARHRFVVKLEGIGLNHILQLERQEGLEGSGVLDGQLPIEISPAGIRVAQGKLAARAPGGTIRYRPAERVMSMVRTNPSLKLVVDALGNFHYQKLEADTNYQPDGNLALHLRLEGKNPDWQHGQPVHLNLNVEENIPVLLRSLQLGGEITERVRKHYERTR